MAGETKQTDYAAYREQVTEEAAQFQDFVMEKLATHGIFIQCYTSKKKQYDEGESPSGFEIKLDRELVNTSNVYIETHEKARPRDGDYAPSGIYRPDNSWLYLIGNRSALFIFGKRNLQALHKREKPDGSPMFTRKETPTSRGFLVPRELAVKYALKVYEFSS